MNEYKRQISELESSIDRATSENERTTYRLQLAKKLAGIDTKRAIEIVSACFPLVKRSNDADALAFAYRVLAECHFYRGEALDALSASFEGERIARECNSLANLVVMLNIRLMFYLQNGDTDTALDYLSQLKTMLGDLGRQDELSIEARYFTYFNVGVASEIAGDTDAAENAYREMVSEAEIYPYPVSQGYALARLARFARNRGETKTAARYLDEARSYEQDSQSRLSGPALLHEEGMLRLGNGEIEHGISLLQQAVEELMMVDIDHGSASLAISEVNRDLAFALLESGDHAQSLRVLETSIENVEKANLKMQLPELLDVKADVHRSLRQHSEEASCLRRARTLRSEIASDQMRLKLEQLRAAEEIRIANEQSERERERRSELEHLHREVSEAHRRTKDLLESVLPEHVAEEILRTGTSEPDLYANVSVLFGDFVGFTSASTTLAPKDLIEELNDVFGEFDRIFTLCGCDRIKTIGDAYMAVCGTRADSQNHAYRIIAAASESIRWLSKRNKIARHQWSIRFGVHSGPVVGGVVGRRRFVYDVFGDTVNIAARFESQSGPMGILVSDSCRRSAGSAVEFEKSRKRRIKGVGVMQSFRVSNAWVNRDHFATITKDAQ